LDFKVTTTDTSLLYFRMIFSGGAKKANFVIPSEKKDYLKVNIVIYVPKIMRAQDPPMEVAARLQERWFAGRKNSQPKRVPPEMEIVTLDWVLGFEKPRNLFLEVQKEEVWGNEAAQKSLVKQIKRMISNGEVVPPSEVGESVPFGDFSSEIIWDQKEQSYMPKFAKYYYQGRPFKPNVFLDPIDDFYASLANFSFMISGKGNFSKLGKDTYEINLQKIGIFVVDSYDFLDDGKMISQPLGLWNPNKNEVSRTADFFVNNESYQEYRTDTDKGRDFSIYSRILELEIDLKFLHSE